MIYVMLLGVYIAAWLVGCLTGYTLRARHEVLKAENQRIKVSDLKP